MNFKHFREYVKSLSYWPLLFAHKGAQIDLKLLTFDEWGIYV